MDARAEERILRLAVRQGLITRDELVALPANDAPERPDAPFGPRIATLIQRGRLDAGTIARLLRDCTMEEPAEGIWGALATDAARAQGALAHTLPGSGAAELAREHGFPVPGWSRYEFVRFVAEGGMGDVYKAYDPRLRRPVALKFWRGSGSSARRFMQEAQAQARVEHANICKVYEVGEVGGRPYIAMQFIEAETAAVATRGLALEEKLRLMAEIALAVHAAHRAGLIHRDLKPTNIMVERAEDGALKPYVLDFGLAREMVASGLTRTGAVMGTPNYMAPEQARGELERLDRRSDVYSLGATLFELVVGRPPFLGTVTEVLMQVLHQDALPVRKIDPAIPRDVETIIAKCLEKEPHRRYDSAKALAADLLRMLDGDPILARPSGPAYRLAKAVRKHRAAVMVTSLMALVAAAFGVVGVSAWRSAAERAQLAQEFGQDIERIQGAVRADALLPLHDVRPNEAQVRQGLAEIEAKMKRLGRIATAPGEYALGRGHLALGEHREARQHLERAWASGARGPDVATALGLALGALYDKELSGAGLIANREARAQRKSELERLYRDPALGYLRRSQGVPLGSSAYVQGLMARYERRYDDALVYARRARAEAPDLYEAWRLEGDVHLLVANLAVEKGAYDAALAEYELAGAAYRGALDIARSDAGLYEGECFRGILLMRVERARKGSLQDAFDHAVTACDQALRANPERGSALVKKGAAFGFFALHEMEHGKDPRPALDQALALVTEGLRWEPQDAQATETRGTIWTLRAEYELRIGQDPRPSLERATDALTKAASLAPNAWTVRSNLGNALSTVGEYEMQHGLDPRPALARAVESYRAAIAVAPGVATAHDNLAGCYATRAEYEASRGLDPGPSLEQAIVSGSKAVELNPSSARTHVNLGSAHALRAMELARRGEDPRPSFARAREAFGRAIALKPELAPAHVNLGTVLRHLADYELEQGRDPSAALAEARAALARGEAIDPRSREMLRERGWVELGVARQALRGAKPPGAAFAAAQTAFERALEVNSQDALAHRGLAQVRLERGAWEWAAQRRGAARAEVAQGLTAAGKALAIHPDLAEALAVRGSLELLSARVGPEGDASRAARHALSTLERAVAENSRLATELAQTVEEARRLAGP